MRSRFDFTPGAQPLGEGRFRFSVWAPSAASVELHVVAPLENLVPMQRGERGYWAVEMEADHSTRYLIRINGEDFPDPASRCQPEGVHGPSAVDPMTFPWSDSTWRGVLLEDYVLYELHIGTFSREGTFQGAIEHLDALVDLGITAIELMPVAQFPGSRNWGYDGVYPFAAQNSYGGVDGLRMLVDAAHSRGLAVVLDVVYNHLGPEGNYLERFGPYFTERYRTPWGRAVNYDDAGSGGVRDFFLSNVIYWIRDCHIDGLRIDAVHAIFDQSARPFLEELAQTVDTASRLLDRAVVAIAESDLNDPRLIRSRELGGWGLDGQWSDDFHHALHTIYTGEKSGYYSDFGSLELLARTFERGYAYDGQYSAHRDRTHGAPLGNLPLWKLIGFSMNHDQIGNRLSGDRLTYHLNAEQRRQLAALVILSPFTPLLFMGEEYGEERPFQYFTSHGDESLIEAVRSGRKREFAAFGWTEEPPDPHAESTFESSRLDWTAAAGGDGLELRRFYRQVIALRRTLQPFDQGLPCRTYVHDDAVMEVTRQMDRFSLRMLFNFGRSAHPYSVRRDETILLQSAAADSLIQMHGFVILRQD